LASEAAARSLNRLPSRLPSGEVSGLIVSAGLPSGGGRPRCRERPGTAAAVATSSSPPHPTLARACRTHKPPKAASAKARVRHAEGQAG